MCTQQREWTVLSVLTGLGLAWIMFIANCYLALFAGMTISASIPAAVISMGFFEVLRRKGALLENNMVQTIASAGESVAAGATFTIPALCLTEAWHEYQYWPTTIIVACGGLLGVFFMIPFRKAIIASDDNSLVFPEGRGCATILRSRETGGAIAVFLSFLIGAAFKSCVLGVDLLRQSVQWAFPVGHRGFYFGAKISPALIGVGYYIGPWVAAQVFIGGIIAWVFLIPALAPTEVAEGGTLLDNMWGVWDTKIRYVGVGAMAVAGVWSIWSIRKPIIKAIGGIGDRSGPAGRRTETDMGPVPVMGGVLLSAFSLLCFYMMTTSFVIAIVGTMLVITLAYILVAISSYSVGIVGSSSNPVSGMVICAVLVMGLIFYTIFNLTGVNGILVTLIIAGSVCCAACTAGDVSQDLMTGRILGATPRLQQRGQVLGVLATSVLVAPILAIFDKAFEIGSSEFPATQAVMISKISEKIFLEGEQMPMDMIGIGALVSILAIVVNAFMKKRKLYPMAIGVGIYLPFMYTFSIFLGGFIRLVVNGLFKERSRMSRGELFAAGLIAGESIAAAIFAIPIAAGKKLPLELPYSGGPTISLLALFGLGTCFFWVCRPNRR